jgi:hypothetical protein
MISQSLGNLNRDSFGTPPWESWDKKPFGCRCRGKMQRILYGGRWEGGGFPRIWGMVNLVSSRSLVACPSTTSALECEITNLLVNLMQVRVTKYSLYLFLVPS